MAQEDVFEFTADVEFTPQDAPEVPLVDAPLAELGEQEQAEFGLPMDWAQYPGIDFSIAPEQRAEHTAAEVWQAWYEGALADPAHSGYGTVEMIERAYQVGLDAMS